jgi:hypothetical protein
MDERYALRMQFDDGSVTEIEMTAEQAMDALQGRGPTWTSPDVPDITVGSDGTIIEHEDATSPVPQEPMMRPGEVELGQRHAALWAAAAEELGADWLRRQGTPLFGMSDRGRATARIGCVTISEDGEGGSDWCVEESGRSTYGRIHKDGRPARRIQASPGFIGTAPTDTAPPRRAKISLSPGTSRRRAAPR